MPCLVPPLDPSSAYIYCPVCEQNGHPRVMLAREQHTLKCPFGHKWDSTNFKELIAAHLTMTRAEEILREDPDPRAIQWPIYVLPETREKFEKKFAGRVHITMGTFLEALCTDQIIFISGDAAGKLKKRGFSNGDSILAALDSMDQLTRERDEAVSSLEKILGQIRSVEGREGQ